MWNNLLVELNFREKSASMWLYAETVLASIWLIAETLLHLSAAPLFNEITNLWALYMLAVFPSLAFGPPICWLCPSFAFGPPIL